MVPRVITLGQFGYGRYIECDVAPTLYVSPRLGGGDEVLVIMNVISEGTDMDTEELKAGDIVTISPNATYYTGRQISALIKSKRWVISSISGNRVLLGKSDDGYYTLNAPVDAKYLTKTSV